MSATKRKQTHLSRHTGEPKFKALNIRMTPGEYANIEAKAIESRRTVSNTARLAIEIGLLKLATNLTSEA